MTLAVYQVQPDMDELEVNMEDNEDVASNKSEVKLGKLQFSLDYDFQKGEVRYSMLDYIWITSGLQLGYNGFIYSGLLLGYIWVITGLYVLVYFWVTSGL